MVCRSRSLPAWKACATQCCRWSLQGLLLDLVERGAHGADLGQHVDAVALVLDHARHAAHLALDAAEPRELGFLQSAHPSLNYTPVGYRWQAMDHTPPPRHAETAIDPVCGMTVKIADARNKARPRRPHLLLLQPALPGQVHRRARALPEARGRQPAPRRPPSRARSTPARCIPEIRQVGPGSCPICGMALEPAEATLEHGPNQELADMTRRLWIGGGARGAGRGARHGRASARPRRTAAARLDRTGCCWCSRRRSCCGRAGRSSCAARSRSARRSLNMFTLIALGTGAAWLYSVVATVAPGLFPPRSAADGRCRSISRRPPSSSCWCCSARCWSCARASRPAAPSRRCSAWRRARRCGSAPTATTRRCRSTRSPSATACACGRARRCRSTAW